MILAIDIGSTLIKGGLVSEKGDLKQAVVRIPCYFDTRSWIDGIETIFKTFEKELDKVIAIAVCGNGPTLVGISGEGDNPIISWMDREHLKYVGPLNERLHNNVRTEYYLAKAYYLMKEKPEVYDSVKLFLPCPEFICFYLTGNPTGFLYSSEAESYLWTEEAINALGLEREKFPPIIGAGNPAGTLLPDLAKKWGASSGIKVFPCGTDFLMSILGTGVTTPGQICDRAGTSEGLNICLASQPKNRSLLVMPHVIKDLYNASGILSTSGKAFEWVLNITRLNEKNLDELFSELEYIEPGCEDLIFLPFLLPGPSHVWDSRMRGSFSGFTLQHSPIHMVRAVLESTGFAMKDILSVIDSDSSIGCQPKEIRVTGTASGTSFWNQLRADITGLPVMVPRIGDSELAGSACMAFYASGYFSSPAEAASQIVRHGRLFEPRSEESSRYRDIYEKYRITYDALKVVYTGNSPDL